MESALDIEARRSARHATRREQRASRAQAVLVAGLSLALHVALATSLGRGQARPSKADREPTRIDIVVRRPPPPPAPPAEAPQQTPPQRAEAPRPARQRPAPAPTPAPAQPAPPPVAAEGTIAPAEVPPTPDAVISAPAQPATPVPSAPVRVEAREGANYRHNPRPSYPRVAQREGWEGTVTLRVNVLPNGRPGAIRVQRSSGRDVLDEAASEAVSGWSFTPALLDGAPTSGWVTVPIVFRLGR